MLEDERNNQGTAIKNNSLKDLAAKIVEIGTGNFSIPISLHGCVCYLCPTFATMNTELQVGKS
ncbi:hypothetical protein H5410_047970 [Solanum commersonii]|uniref:Uncharacterized protein n=1 Tax=Solanum commersonii TaxID=4109 RepID=A0A9J5XKJ6_SOLCO|nr:hypothetical protein H5410_047970 [Solanum commersonii]